ncbi:hypothetical protein SADUNF_Sadunf15G0051400 [Salix dunnii]|uniref:Exocyst subunit Exo70 family protein n=1 Tax=Salix dunnii TaxID=1413687 RepID=A0A835JID3_9ROSI|nr:hypothetical protein SADUNF_Sadunf15G0051400 [Salix dunnii]
MPGCQSMTTTYEGEQHVIAAAQHILKVLGENKNLTGDFRRVLTELDSHLSAMTIITESKRRGFSEVEEQLKCAERKVMRWESNPSLIWDSGPTEASEYIQAVNEIHTVMETLGGLSMNDHGRPKELAFRAQCVQQIAMSRLEEELYHILVQHKQSFELKNISFPSRVDFVYDESFVSVEDEIVNDTSQRDKSGRESNEYIVDLIDPLLIPDIKSIASVMFASGYDREFCEAFIGNRKDALDEHLSNLEIQKLSIDDVLNSEWDILSCEIKKWVRAVKIIIRVYLASEKQFCNQILGDFGSHDSYCFVEISRASIFYLLNFGEAIALGPYNPEKLFRFLDMYEVLADLHLDMEGLFSEVANSFVMSEFHDLLRRLGASAITTFLEFQNAIALNASIHPFPRGEIHPLTRYVMNYITTLTAYGDTLNLLLKDPNPVLETDSGQDICTSAFSPMGCHLRSITSTLESNLIRKSKLYKDGSLEHIFLMNNIHYMVQKVKGSELRLFFGDEWIRKHNGKFQQHATSYERATWSFVVSLLRDDGRTSLKERCRRFSNAFNDVYKIQTRWCIPDLQLREDLQISTSQKVIPAYRAFLAINSRNGSDKYIKYTSDDMEKMLLDLFAGPSMSLRNSHRW